MDFKLDLLKLKAAQLQKVGEWTPGGSLVITDKYAFTEGRPPNITLRVLSRIEEPFVMFRKVIFFLASKSNSKVCNKFLKFIFRLLL